MTGAAGPVVGFGELLLRLKSPGATRLLQEGSLEAGFGGAEFNVLASLSRFGHPTEFVSLLPPNALGVAALESIRRHGVGTRHVRSHPGRMGLYFAEAGADLRPGSVVYDREGSAFSRLVATDLDWAGILKEAGWLHVTGITAALGTGPAAAMLAAMRVAGSLGIPVSLDVNMRPSLWAASGRKPRETLQPLLQHATHLFAGLDDWEACFDAPPPQGDREAAVRQFLALLLESNPRARVAVSGTRISNGADDQQLSAFAAARDGSFAQARTVRVRHVVDRIGAGDAMVAGCLLLALEGASWQEALDFGVVAGALKHTVPGDVSLVSRAEVEAALAGVDGGRLRR